jgi:4-cresol dehydrogenase (hydroxylating)
MFQCGMEVCLPDGRLMRTGMGSIKGSTAWQAFKWGYGPYLDGLFTSRTSASSPRWACG